MSEVKIELLSDGIQALMKSQEMVACLQQYANDIAMSSGGVVTGPYIGKTRANVSVYSDNENNSLLKSMR